MKRKILVLLFSIIILTGCNINAELEINSDLIIDGKLKIIEKKMFVEELSPPDMENIIKSYNGSIKDNYGFDIDINSINELDTDLDKDAIINFDIKKSINEIINDEFLSYFGEILIKESRNYKVTFLPNESFILSLQEEEYNGILIENFELKLTLPFKAISSNADNITNNTYTWTLNEKNLKNEMWIEFENDKYYLNLLKYIVYVFGVIIIIAGMGYLIYRKSKKVNEI